MKSIVDWLSAKGFYLLTYFRTLRTISLLPLKLFMTKTYGLDDKSVLVL